MWLFSKIEPEFKFSEILGKVFTGYPDMSTANTTLQLAPESFNGVGMSIAAYPLLGGVIHRQMPVRIFPQSLVGGPFIGADGRSRLNEFGDVGEQGFDACVWHDAGNDITIPLDHAEYDGLAFGPASREALFSTSTPATNVSLIGFHMTREWGIAVNLCHVLADFVAHAPRSLVGHAQLALQFLRGYAVARRGEQIHGVKPFLHGRPRARKGCPNHRVNVMAAPLAHIGRLLAETMKLGVLPALRAIALFAVANPHKMIEAGVVVREAIEKLLDCEWLSHCLSPYPSNIGYRST